MEIEFEDMVAETEEFNESLYIDVLKNCPFCGSHAVEILKEPGKDEYFVSCNAFIEEPSEDGSNTVPTCEARGPLESSPKAAADAWNKRVTEITTPVESSWSVGSHPPVGEYVCFNKYSKPLAIVKIQPDDTDLDTYYANIWDYKVPSGGYLHGPILSYAPSADKYWSSDGHTRASIDI